MSLLLRSESSAQSHAGDVAHPQLDSLTDDGSVRRRRSRRWRGRRSRGGRSCKRVKKGGRGKEVRGKFLIAGSGLSVAGIDVTRGGRMIRRRGRVNKNRVRSRHHRTRRQFSGVSPRFRLLEDPEEAVEKGDDDGENDGGRINEMLESRGDPTRPRCCRRSAR